MMSVICLHRVAHFQPGKVAHFQPVKVAQIQPAKVAQIQPALTLDSHYDLAQVKQYVLGADGAHWTKEGMDYFTPALFQQATAGNLDAVLGSLTDLQAKAQGGQKEGRLEQLKGYLRDNADGLVDYRLRLPLTEEERRKLPSLGPWRGTSTRSWPVVSSEEG